ncbi:MAG TPA: serpin family protein [Steroidobacteraceae bacterium]|nr:serpin family protein [Steroidobacteraceae bacterium]
MATAEKNDTPVDPAIVSADNAFGLSLLDALLPASIGGNVAISPTSVALALQVLYNGAAGSTQQGMAQALDLGTLDLATLNNDNAALQASLSNADPAVQVLVANSLWLDQSNNPVLPSFTQADQTFYGATVGDLAGAPDNVNAWVASQTQGLITQLLPPGEYKDAIIANVLYFKGQWTTSFDPNNTAAAPFTLSGGGQTSAQLMHLTASFAHAAGSLNGTGYQAIRIPYGQTRFDMLIIAPDASTDIVNFVANLTGADLNNVTAQLAPAMVKVGLPRFSASYQASLTDALQAMGMGATFMPMADFSALAPGFWVNVVVHKTVVEVNESGTVAAAATGVGMTAIVSQNDTMTMDHPFFYAIEDGKTGALLFIGVLMNPNGQ